MMIVTSLMQVYTKNSWHTDTVLKFVTCYRSLCIHFNALAHMYVNALAHMHVKS